MFFSLFIALCVAAAHDDARNAMENFLDELNCNMDPENYVDSRISSNFVCGGFFVCADRAVVSVNLSTPIGVERCLVGNANLTRAFRDINRGSGVNVTSLDLRNETATDLVSPRLPRGLDSVSSLQTCAIWTESQFRQHPANSPTEPCCEVAPYASPCVTQFMDLYKKYTGLSTCKLCPQEARPVPPTCSDGVQNGNETGIDCGGNCSESNCCSNGYRDADEDGVDCSSMCGSCRSGDAICSSDDPCCVRTQLNRDYQCRGEFSPRCASSCSNRGRNGCELFFSGWLSDNTCRPLAQTGICAVDRSTCLPMASYTVETCVAVSRPDDSIVFATCDVGCRKDNTCVGPLSNESSTLQSLCFLDGKRNCASGSECNRNGKCVETVSQCTEPCAEIDQQYGGCKGVCTSFPCTVVESRCGCVNTIAPSSTPGVCLRTSSAPATCSSRTNCTCDESDANAVPHLQCEQACLKPNATCVVGTPAANWTLERICNVSGETCSLPSGAGMCNRSGRCVPANDRTLGASSTTSARTSDSLQTLSTRASQSSTSVSLDSTLASDTSTSGGGSSSPLDANSDSITTALMTIRVNDVDRSSPDSQLPIIIGAVLGALCLLLLIVVVVAIVWKRRRRDASNEQISDRSAYLGNYGPSAYQTVNPSTGVYGAAPIIGGGHYDAPPELMDYSSSSEALPGDTRMKKTTQVIYDRAM